MKYLMNEKEMNDSPIQLTITAAEQMKKFNKRYNKVLMDKVALEQEKHHLLEDNKRVCF